jgi:hypothetical protein
MRLPPEIRAALDATGLPWTSEVTNSGLKIRVGGRLAGVIGQSHSRTAYNRHNSKNLIAQIRRIAKELP